MLEFFVISIWLKFRNTKHEIGSESAGYVS